jgi:hypothetical protein
VLDHQVTERRLIALPRALDQRHELHLCSPLP